MLAICARAMEDGQRRINREYALMNESRRRMRAMPFLDGMADTLARRIRELKPPRPTGTGLIVLHNALVDQALKDRGVKLDKMRTRASRNLDPEYLKGLAAAESVRLDRGLRGPGSQTRGLLR